MQFSVADDVVAAALFAFIQDIWHNYSAWDVR